MFARPQSASSGLIVLAVTTCIATLVWLVLDYGGPSCVREPFDQQRWLNGALPLDNNNDPGCVRGGMAIDLLDRNALENLSKESVVRLLGYPNQEHGLTYYYDLGQCSGWGWHHSKLVLSFSNAGAVVRTDFTRDTR